PERTTPSIICRWKIANTIIIGMTATADPAVIMFHCAPTSPENSDSPTGSVYICRDSATIRGHKYAFQLPMKVRMARAAREGFTRGKAMRQYSPNSLRPSRSEEHTSELQSRENLVCRLLLEKKKRGDHG